MGTEISRRKWLAIMLASLPSEVSSEIRRAPELFKIVDGRMGDNSCQYLYGPNDEWLAYSIGWWNGEWAMVHEVTFSPPPDVVVQNAQTIRELIGRDVLLEEPDELPT